MLDMKANLRVAAYVRVSTDEQAQEGYSIEAQKRQIAAYAESQGYTIASWYVDEGRSAYSDKKRPAFDRMMRERDSWDIAVAKWLNRFWRRVVPALTWAKELDAAGKGFACVVERIDTSTAMGRAMFQIMLVMAELESGQTAERVGAALDEKFKSGNPENFGRPAYGYDIPAPKETGGDGLLVVNPSEAEVVRGIFASIIAGHTTREIVRELKASGFRGKNGGKASEVEVVQIAHGPVYAGYVHRGGILRRNGHEAIVDDDTFNRAQIALYRRTSRHHRVPLIVGAKEIEVTRTTPKGKSLTAFIPKVRPPGLDAMVAAEAVRSPVRRRRRHDG